MDFYIFAIQFFQMSAVIEGSWISVYLSAFNWLRSYLQFFVIASIGHLENTGSLSYINLPNVDPVHYIISKNHITITTYLIKKPKYWKDIKHLIVDTSFPEILIFTSTFEFYHGQHYQLFSLKGSLPLYLKKYLPNSQLWQPKYESLK